MDTILPLLVYPLGLSLLLLAWGLLLLALGRRVGAGLVVSLALGWLYAWSTPVVSDVVRASLEGAFANEPVEALPSADAIVLLGGGVDPMPADWPYADLNSGADRVWHAARVYHAGKAPVVVVSGGRVPGREDRVSEAEAMRALLVDLGVPADAIVLEDRALSTRENAVFVAEELQRLGAGDVLLVTSALHMPRALASFAGLGLNPQPAPTDFSDRLPPDDIVRWLPDAQSLARSTAALREYLGLWVYRWRGWT
jgi:uncharacterized SAM-binding protein YcdF (DUF218 family)